MKLLTRRNFCLTALSAAMASITSQVSFADTSKGATHRVIIDAFKFVPATVTIKVGDTVEWINRDTVPHTATDTAKTWDTDNLDTDQSALIEFTSAGTYNYLCSYHPVMQAKIIVSAD